MKVKSWITAVCCRALVVSFPEIGLEVSAKGTEKNLKEYIVHTDNEFVYDELSDKYEPVLIRETQNGKVLEEENMLLMDLTSIQAQTLDSQIFICREKYHSKESKTGTQRLCCKCTRIQQIFYRQCLLYGKKIFCCYIINC